MKTSESEDEVKFHFSMFMLFGNSLISSLNSIRKINKLNLKFDIVDNKNSSPNSKNNEAIFSFKDKILMGTYHCLYKYLPEYSIQLTDYISKIVGKSCKSLALVLVLFLHKTPIIGSLLDGLINESHDSKYSNLKKSDFIKAILNCLSIILFAWKGYAWEGKK